MKKRSPNFWVSLLAVAGWVTGQPSWGQSEPPPGAKAPFEARPKAPPQPPPLQRDRPPTMPPRDGGPGGDRGERRLGPEGERFGGDRDRRGPGGSKGMGGGGFEKLSEDHKRRVREALAKAWGRHEVTNARDRLMEANETMRRVIHEALLEIDPEIAKILANMKDSEGMGGRGEPPRLPPVESPDFPAAAIKRLEMELLVFSPPERRDETRQLLARVQDTPVIRDAVTRLKKAPIEDRMRVMEELRKLYREVVGEEMKAFHGRNKEPSVKHPPTEESPPAKKEAPEASSATR